MPRLLAPIMETMRSLTTSGTLISTPAGLSTIRVKLVMGIFDLQQMRVFCVKQYNGRYGCTVCEHPGERLSNRANVYPPGTYLIRTHASVVQAAEDVEQNNAPVNKGVKGLSPLATTLDLVSSFPLTICMLF